MNVSHGVVHLKGGRILAGGFAQHGRVCGRIQDIVNHLKRQADRTGDSIRELAKDYATFLGARGTTEDELKRSKAQAEYWAKKPAQPQTQAAE